MTARRLEELARLYLDAEQCNIVPKEKAFAPEFAGMEIYEPPLFGYASAEDIYFDQLRESSTANADRLMLPGEWLEGAKTVISFFLPFSQAVRRGNSRDMRYPSDEWLHARIEGQDFMVALCEYLVEQLAAAGHQAVIPAADSRLQVFPGFTSNWSERHAAYACGLGTFSLNKGLITSKGMAGRFGSLISDLELPPTPRAYSSLYEYCIMCAACARNCPADAITLEGGKDHLKCKPFLDRILEERSPYYGCGKCQVGVPCEARIPAKATAG